METGRKMFSSSSTYHLCSALRQVLGTQLLHSSLFSALLFIFSKKTSFRSSSIPILGLPSASCQPFYPPSLLLIVLLLAKHAQSNSFFVAQSSQLIFDFL